MATLCINGLAVSQVPLPCTAVASHQIYPFITVHPGMLVSLHEASTPSPLFTWYSPTASTTDISMVDMDTCVKYNSTTTTSSSTNVSEFQVGSLRLFPGPGPHLAVGFTST